MAVSGPNLPSAHPPLARGGDRPRPLLQKRVIIGSRYPSRWAAASAVPDFVRFFLLGPDDRRLCSSLGRELNRPNRDARGRGKRYPSPHADEAVDLLSEPGLDMVAPETRSGKKLLEFPGGIIIDPTLRPPQDPAWDLLPITIRCHDNIE